jgi:hypothetical protein
MEATLRVIDVEWDDLDDDLKALLCVSDQLYGEEQMAREIILDLIDPVSALGEPFSFEDREGLEVPLPWAQVDLGKAWEVARSDAEACRLTLEEDHSIEATLRVYRNTIGWLRFWSSRWPNRKWRERFERELRVREEVLNRLQDRAKWRFEFEIMEALNNV